MALFRYAAWLSLGTAALSLHKAVAASACLSLEGMVPNDSDDRLFPLLCLNVY
jgi:hypothetical protein